MAAPVEVGIIDSAAARAAVEVLVELVLGGLVVGVGVHRRHEALLDADRVVHHLGERRQAIGGAGGVGDDEMVAGQLVVVDAVDDGEIGIVGRRGDEDALGAGVEMRLGLLLGSEEAGAFERDVDPERLPGQFRRVLDRGHLDRPGAAIDGVAGDHDLAGKAAMDRIEAQQMGIGLDRGEIVERHHLDVLAAGLDDGAQDIAADAAKPVDGDPH